VGASFAATVVGALVLGSAADKIDPALLEDGAGDGRASGAGPRRARVSLAAEREAEQQQQRQRQQQQQEEVGGAKHQQKQGDGTT
jgi:hypothetical protein